MQSALIATNIFSILYSNNL